MLKYERHFGDEFYHFLKFRAMSGENILSESTATTVKEVKPKHIGRDRKDDLHMDEDDEISTPREPNTSPNAVVVDDEKTAHHNEKEEPKNKVSKKNKLSHSSTEDIDITSKF